MTGYLTLTPLFAVILSASFGLIGVFFLLAKNAPFEKVVLFSMACILLKAFPFWYCMNHDKHYGNDARAITATIALFALYMVWLDINGKEITAVYTDLLRSYSRPETIDSAQEKK